MPWSGDGSFSRTNGVNTGTDVWETDRDSAVKIRSDRHDTHDQDLASGINNCLTKDGQNAATENLDLGGYTFKNAQNLEWINPLSATYASSTSFTVSTDKTATHHVGRRVKAVGSSTGTIYGTISASSYSAPDTTVTVTWDSGSLSNEALTVSIGLFSQTNSADPLRTDLASTASGKGGNLVTFRRSTNASAAERTVQSRMEATISIEDMGGGYSKTAAQNATAISRCLTEFGGDAGIILLEDPGDYDLGEQIDLPRDVSFQGVGYPGSDPTNAPVMSKFNRVADVILFRMVGTDRTTDRVGRNAFKNVGFTETVDVSTKALIYAKYADSLVFKHSLYWHDGGATSIGHVIDVEECWDWLFSDMLFKQAGLAASNKYALNIYNGADDSSNDFKFHMVRWQESNGDNINFDSSGGGNTNSRFWFTQCKLEDARGTKITPVHIQGVANRVYFSQTTFSGCATKHIDMPSGASVWSFHQSQFANGGTGIAEYMTLAGAKHTVDDCVFDSPPVGLTQYINSTGADGNIEKNKRTDTTPPLLNSSGVNATTKVGRNPDWLTEYAGSSSVPNTGNFVDVTHNLAYTPTARDINIAPTSLFNNGVVNLIVGNITSTTFRVTATGSAGSAVTPTTAIGFDWSAQRVRG